MEFIYKEPDTYLTLNSKIDKDYYEDKIKKGVRTSYFQLMYCYYLIRNSEIHEARKILDKLHYEKEDSYLESLKLMNMGLIYSDIGDNAQAENDFLNALESDLNKHNKWLRLELFKYYNGRQDYKAWGYLEEALEIDPNFVQAKIEKGYQLDEDLNCYDVISVLSDIPETYKDSDAMNVLGVALINCRRYEEAKIALEKSITYAPSSNNYFSLAQLYHEHYQNYSMARDYYLKSIEYDKSNLDAINGHAWLLYDLHQWDLAEEQLLSLLLYTNDQEIYNQIINFYLLTGNLDKAESKVIEAESFNGISFITDGYKIIIQIFHQENYESLIIDYRTKYSENNISWLKSQIKFFFDMEY